jgi:hypothetical protein
MGCVSAHMFHLKTYWTISNKSVITFYIKKLSAEYKFDSFTSNITPPLDEKQM